MQNRASSRRREKTRLTCARSHGLHMLFFCAGARVRCGVSADAVTAASPAHAWLQPPVPFHECAWVCRQAQFLSLAVARRLPFLCSGGLAAVHMHASTHNDRFTLVNSLLAAMPESALLTRRLLCCDCYRLCCSVPHSTRSGRPRPHAFMLPLLSPQLPVFSAHRQESAALCR